MRALRLLLPCPGLDTVTVPCSCFCTCSSAPRERGLWARQRPIPCETGFDEQGQHTWSSRRTFAVRRWSGESTNEMCPKSQPHGTGHLCGHARTFIGVWVEQTLRLHPLDLQDDILHHRGCARHGHPHQIAHLLGTAHSPYLHGALTTKPNQPTAMMAFRVRQCTNISALVLRLSQPRLLSSAVVAEPHATLQTT